MIVSRHGRPIRVGVKMTTTFDGEVVHKMSKEPFNMKTNGEIRIPLGEKNYSIPTIIYVIIIDISAFSVIMMSKSIVIIVGGIIAVLCKIAIDIFDHYTECIHVVGQTIELPSPPSRYMIDKDTDPYKNLEHQYIVKAEYKNDRCINCLLYLIHSTGITGKILYVPVTYTKPKNKPDKKSDTDTTSLLERCLTNPIECGTSTSTLETQLHLTLNTNDLPV